jgi:hypothetical protein
MPKEKANDKEDDRRYQRVDGDYSCGLGIKLPIQTDREADKK